MIELLSPAGSIDALRAAVQCGANAVYLGLGALNARSNAKNFTPDELREAVKFCHIRGVQVHLTLNTLTSDRELDTAAKLLRTAVGAGIDAVIIQDLGVAQLCRQICPDLPIHASTQMSIHSLDGVLEAADLGVRRVVLARELSRDNIAAIAARSPVELEVFVHGALCMCYSGQCYMSAMIGRRSGNRGACAQPCRLPYGYNGHADRYPLSLRDNCLVEHLAELREMGIASLKIEGRMKRPEYVAIATSVYRRALDGSAPTGEDMRQLEAAFSRQGFTDAYWRGAPGRDMLGTRQEEAEDKKLFAAARAMYESGERECVGVAMRAQVRAGQSAVLTVADADGNLATATGPAPEKARTRALTEEELHTRLTRTGGTPFYCRELITQLDDGLSLSAAALNSLRRDALSQLTALRGRVTSWPLQNPQPVEVCTGHTDSPALTVQITTSAQLTRELCKSGASMIYAPAAVLLEQPDFTAMLARAATLGVVVPRVIPDGDRGRVCKQLTQLYQMGLRHALCGNLGHLRMLHELGFRVHGDFGLNVYNSRTMQVLQQLGVQSATASIEMTLAQLRDLSKPLDMELIAYGRLPLMLTENCLIRNRTGTCTCGGAVKLTDRAGEEFPILRDGDSCRSVVLNGKKLWLLDKQPQLSKLGLWALRLLFTTENAGEVNAVLRAWKAGSAMEPGVCTRGLYLRGVE